MNFPPIPKWHILYKEYQTSDRVAKMVFKHFESTEKNYMENYPETKESEPGKLKLQINIINNYEFLIW